MTKTFKIKLLEDTSNTSYVNEIPKPSTTTGANNYYGDPDDYYDDRDDQDDYYDFDDFFESPFEFGR